jgi:hypothetical protein
LKSIIQGLKLIIVYASWNGVPSVGINLIKYVEHDTVMVSISTNIPGIGVQSIPPNPTR